MDTEKPRLLGEAENYDYQGGYEWGTARCYTHKGRFYIIQDSGCSCNSPEETYTEDSAVVGPAATLGGLLDELVVDAEKHHKCVKEAFLNAVDNVNKETVASVRKVLGL